MLMKAAKLVREKFAGVVDASGAPYELHCYIVGVMTNSDNEEDTIIGILHDIVEDTDVTLEELSEDGYSDYVVSGVDAISKRKEEKGCWENYLKYLKRVKAHEGARKAKIADLGHNMDLSRLPKVGKYELKRHEKYVKAFAFLLDLEQS